MSRILVVSAALALLPGAAWATCSIKNETGHSFKVESGNVSNQSVGSHTSTTISAGTIIAKTDSGKTVTGSCKDGDRIKIVEESGALIIKPQ
jgi:hypothetical protein